MANFTELVEEIKKIVVKTVEASKPCGIYFGTVITKSPLKINVEQKMILESPQLIVTQTANNNISNNSKVVLLRVQGGQKYMVLDKVI